MTGDTDHRQTDRMPEPMRRIIEHLLSMGGVHQAAYAYAGWSSGSDEPKPEFVALAGALVEQVVTALGGQPARPCGSLEQLCSDMIRFKEWMYTYSPLSVDCDAFAARHRAAVRVDPGIVEAGAALLGHLRSRHSALRRETARAEAADLQPLIEARYRSLGSAALVFEPAARRLPTADVPKVASSRCPRCRKPRVALLLLRTRIDESLPHGAVVHWCRTKACIDDGGSCALTPLKPTRRGDAAVSVDLVDRRRLRLVERTDLPRIDVEAFLQLEHAPSARLQQLSPSEQQAVGASLRSLAEAHVQLPKVGGYRSGDAFPWHDCRPWPRTSWRSIRSFGTTVKVRMPPPPDPFLLQFRAPADAEPDGGPLVALHRCRTCSQVFPLAQPD